MAIAFGFGHPVVRFSDVEAMAAAAIAGLGPAQLPIPLVREHVASGSPRQILLSNSAKGVEVHAVSLRQRSLSNPAMPTPTVLMSKIRQALQLLADPGLSTRQVAAALGISKTTVSEIALYARDAGVGWPLAATLSDDELQARLYPPPRPRSSSRREPDYAALHQELKRPGVTLQLWEEYRAGADGQAYRYSAFCDKYRAASISFALNQVLQAALGLCQSHRRE